MLMPVSKVPQEKVAKETRAKAKEKGKVKEVTAPKACVTRCVTQAFVSLGANAASAMIPRTLAERKPER